MKGRGAEQRTIVNNCFSLSKTEVIRIFRDNLETKQLGITILFGRYPFQHFSVCFIWVWLLVISVKCICKGNICKCIKADICHKCCYLIFFKPTYKISIKKPKRTAFSKVHPDNLNQVPQVNDDFKNMIYQPKFSNISNHLLEHCTKLSFFCTICKFFKYLGFKWSRQTNV